MIKKLSCNLAFSALELLDLYFSRTTDRKELPNAVPVGLYTGKVTVAMQEPQTEVPHASCPMQPSSITSTLLRRTQMAELGTDLRRAAHVSEFRRKAERL